MILTFYAATAAAVASLVVAVVFWRIARRRWWRAGLCVAGIILLVLTAPAGGLAGYLAWRLQAGQPSPTFATPAEFIGGCFFRQEALTVPNLAFVHVLAVPEPASRRFVVSAPVATPGGLRCTAMTATAAAEALEADYVVNANFFTPFRDNWFLDYAPHAGDFVEPVGTVVSDYQIYGRPKADWPAFWQRHDGTIGLGDLPEGVRDAVTGRQWLLRNGSIAIRQDEPPYPRTAVATNADRSRVWLVVVDGKQPNYSDGLTLGDLATYLANLGATDAIELDGGGSSTFVYSWHNGPVVLNRPCHTKIPGRQRPCGVFLGVRQN